MKINLHTFASDDDDGTNADVFGTEAEAEDRFLEAIGQSREAFDAWLVDNPDGDIWQFKDAEGETDFLDTFNLDEKGVDIDLCAQRMPSCDVDKARQALECLRRARDLLRASSNKQSLGRVTSCIYSVRGAIRINEGRKTRAQVALRRNMDLDPFTDGQAITEAHGWRIGRSDGKAVLYALQGMGAAGFGGETAADMNANAVAHVRAFGLASYNADTIAFLRKCGDVETAAYYRLCGKALDALDANEKEA